MTPRAVRWVLALALAASACTGRVQPPSASPAAPGTPDPRAPTPSGPDPLCQTRDAAGPPRGDSDPSPSTVVSEVAEQVEQVRGLEFKETVSPEAITRAEIGGLVQRSIEAQFPVEMMDRRGRAWAAIGAIPAGTDLYAVIAEFGTGQTIGFYDTATQRLVYVSADPPSPLHRLTLAHELTHALDDQHFDLGLVDELVRTCQDERMEALVALAEGDAVEMSLRWAQANLTASELVDLGVEVAADPGPPASIPAFVRDMFVSPYLRGQAFVRALLASGGQEALDAAFRDPPRSTEQVLHPEKYGLDEPRLVQVPDVEDDLGDGWDDLDVQDVGEAWLLRLLDLELPSSDASDAAAGWDGGQYRAWSTGTATAVAMETVWDSEDEAAEFADAVETYAQGRPVAAGIEGQEVRVLFASDERALEALEAALAGG
jgi:hypothetical protein